MFSECFEYESENQWDADRSNFPSKKFELDAQRKKVKKVRKQVV